MQTKIDLPFLVLFSALQSIFAVKLECVLAYTYFKFVRLVVFLSVCRLTHDAVHGQPCAGGDVLGEVPFEPAHQTGGFRCSVVRDRKYCPGRRVISKGIYARRYRIKRTLHEGRRQVG